MDMKKILVAICAVWAMSSCDDEKDFYNEMHATIANPLTWEMVDNQLQIDVEIPQYITDLDTQKNIHLKASTQATALVFPFAIERQITADQWELVEQPNLTQVAGSTQLYPESGLYLATATEVNAFDFGSYVYQAKTQLPAGSYRVNFAPNEINKTKATFTTVSAGTELTFILQANLPNLENGYSYFTID